MEDFIMNVFFIISFLLLGYYIMRGYRYILGVPVFDHKDKHNKKDSSRFSFVYFLRHIIKTSHVKN